MTTFVKASCYCGLNTFKIPFKTTNLPQSISVCHCNICRHTTGQMCLMDARFDGEPLKLESTEDDRVPASLEHLTAYNSSATTTRYFCTKCSAHMFFQSKAQGPHWSVSSGVLEKTDGVVTVANHIFVGDTLDGGVADHYQRNSDDVPIPRYRKGEDGDSLPLGWKDGDAKVSDTLPVHCHCKSVSFFLTRATEINDTKTEYWLVPGKEASHPIRFIAAHCLCNSCRLTSGSQIQSWAIVPPKNIIDPNTSSAVNLFDTARRPKSLKQYESTPSKHREFCKTCGATVFWWSTAGILSHMDVSIGLVDQCAGGGARAEGWLSWHESIIHQGFAISPETAKALVEGIKKQAHSNLNLSHQ